MYKPRYRRIGRNLSVKYELIDGVMKATRVVGNTAKHNLNWSSIDALLKRYQFHGNRTT